MLPVCSGVGNQEETVVVEDIAAIARRTCGAVADPHTNRGLFVGGVPTPVGFPANSTRSVFGNATKTSDSNSLSPLKVDGPALVGRNMN